MSDALIPHFHRGSLEIVYIHKGSQIYEMNGVQYSLSGGDVFVTPPNVPHSSGKYGVDKSSFVWMHIDMSARTGFMGLEEQYADALINQLSRLKNPVLRGNPAIKKSVEAAIGYFISSLDAPKDDQAFLLAQMARDILGVLFRIIKTDVSNDCAKLSDDIESILVYINSNYDRELETGTLASMIYLSESRFRQKFKQQVGIPPIEFIWRKRISRAKVLLHGTDMTMAEISENLAFQNSSYFSKVFKKFNNLTPSEYRNNAAHKTTP